MKPENEKDGILGKPVWMMTGKEFSEMLRQIIADSVRPGNAGEVKIARGLDGLKEHLGCGKTRLVELGKLGVLDKAVISSVGKQKLYDVDRALDAVRYYMKTIKK